MQTHYVQKNETWESIAKQYGLPHGDLVYYAPCNSRLKLYKSKSEKLQPGEVVHIPANAVVEAQRKLDNLRRIKEEYVAMNTKILNEWSSEYSRIKMVAGTVDMVFNISMGLKNIIKEGFKAMELSGKLLEEANNKLAKSAVEFAYDPLKDVAIEKVTDHFTEIKPDEGIVMSLGKDALHFLLVDLNSFSYWIGKGMGINIEETNQLLLGKY